jgi:hypothetical protein
VLAATPEEVVPVVLVIIILVAWAVILGPSLLKRRARSGGDQSITHFHHQLRILEHSAPEPIVAPAYRLRAVDDNGTPTAITYPDRAAPPKLTVVGAKELPRPALAFLGEPVEPVAEAPAPLPVAQPAVHAPLAAARRHPDPDGYADAYAGDLYAADGYDDRMGRPRPPRDRWTGPTAPDAYDDGTHTEGFARHQARRRRRDTLAVLVAVFLTALVFAAVSGATALWAVCIADAIALAGYVTLLVHMQRLALERERKLHYLDARDGGRAARMGGLPTQVSGRYAHPSNQQAVAR